MRTSDKMRAESAQLTVMGLIVQGRSHLVESVSGAKLDIRCGPDAPPEERHEDAENHDVENSVGKQVSEQYAAKHRR